MKRLSISQPVVIDTQITPLTDSFWLEASGALEQWYDVENNTYTPNRQETPLRITPKVEAFDKETGITYKNVSFSSDISWSILAYNYVSNTWNTVSPNPILGFTIDGNTLVVTRNYSDSEHAITIHCKARYIDPRNSNRTYTVEGSLDISASRHSQVVAPNLSLNVPNTVLFNPLSQSDTMALNAKVDWSGIDTTGFDIIAGQEQPGVFVWFGIDDNGNEVLLNTLPYCLSKSTQYTDFMRISRLYNKTTTVILRIKKHIDDSDTTGLLPSRAQTCIAWRIPPITGIVNCDNGNTVRATDNKKYFFNTIVSTNEGVVNEYSINKNLRFNWKLRKATPQNTDSSIRPIDDVYDIGWGRQISIDAQRLKNTTTTSDASRLVFNDIYLLSPLERVETENSEAITYNDEVIYSRGID